MEKVDRESSSESDAFLLKDDIPWHGAPDAPRRQRRFLWAVSFGNAVLLLISVLLLLTSLHARRSLLRNDDNALLKQIDAYSPVYDQVHVPLLDTTVNGTLLDRADSIYRRPPSPEVDAAWAAITHQLPHVIRTADVLRLGKDPSKTARWPAEWGFGADAHIAELDLVHTVHCLDTLRKDIHWRYYFGGKYPDGRFSRLHRTHTDHCVYVLLQSLMCNANGDVITNVWVEGQRGPYPDFSVNKKCRDYGALMGWHERTQITDMERYRQMEAPEGAFRWRMSQDFHDLFETGLEGGSVTDEELLE
ncbi:hypothetical protein ISF_07794 [Cordyceps fumosorosea ARSEF 2679]|uniref:Tat pathway signal sequence n=1 Tax=Cordyceps fumosorosea (strain ARSEF 2679) TaxID=1081104 RepID=A0A167NLH5_CORFA|nr:hypothetical protein ISF_07794 [Cordyceps fumosorosea ARSEF 2679]OAA55689.1 hypothetical protein ISF_07794 [Cordyceps fumosorosea ARSEF 2679]